MLIYSDKGLSVSCVVKYDAEVKEHYLNFSKKDDVLNKIIMYEVTLEDAEPSLTILGDFPTSQLEELIQSKPRKKYKPETKPRKPYKRRKGLKRNKPEGKYTLTKKLTLVEKEYLKFLSLNTYNTDQEIADLFGIHSSNVYRCRKQTCYKSIEPVDHNLFPEKGFNRKYSTFLPKLKDFKEFKENV